MGGVQVHFRLIPEQHGPSFHGTVPDQIAQRAQPFEALRHQAHLDRLLSGTLQKEPSVALHHLPADDLLQPGDHAPGVRADRFRCRIHVQVTAEVPAPPVQELGEPAPHLYKARVNGQNLPRRQEHHRHVQEAFGHLLNAQPLLLMPRLKIKHQVPHAFRHPVPLHGSLHMGMGVPAVPCRQPGQSAGRKHPHQVLPEPLFLRPFLRQGLPAPVRAPV